MELLKVILDVDYYGNDYFAKMLTRDAANTGNFNSILKVLATDWIKKKSVVAILENALQSNEFDPQELETKEFGDRFKSLKNANQNLSAALIVAHVLTSRGGALINIEHKLESNSDKTIGELVIEKLWNPVKHEEKIYQVLSELPKLSPSWKKLFATIPIFRETVNQSASHLNRPKLLLMTAEYLRISILNLNTGQIFS
jgi:hypothetical protein